MVTKWLTLTACLLYALKRNSLAVSDGPHCSYAKNYHKKHRTSSHAIISTPAHQEKCGRHTQDRVLPELRRQSLGGVGGALSSDAATEVPDVRPGLAVKQSSVRCLYGCSCPSVYMWSLHSLMKTQKEYLHHFKGDRLLQRNNFISLTIIGIILN